MSCIRLQYERLGKNNIFECTKEYIEIPNVTESAGVNTKG